MPELALFETRTMLEALEQMYPPKTFLKDTFFPGGNTFTTKHVDIDIQKGKRRLAVYVKPTAEGKLVERIGFKTHSYIPPYVKMKTATTAQDFLTRNLGDTIYGAGDGPQARAEKQLGKDLAELDDMITRLEELQASQLLHTGKVIVNGEGYSDEIDFALPPSHQVVLAGADLWSDGANSDSIGDLKTWKRIISKDSGLIPSDIIMGIDAMDAFVNHPKIKDVLDTRRIDLGQITPELLAGGVTYYGRLRELGIDMYAYEEYYLDNAGNEQPLIDPKKVLMATMRARTSTNYGAIQDLKANFAVPRFPKSWETEDPSVRWVMLQSVPLLALHQVDAFLVAQVLA